MLNDSKKTARLRGRKEAEKFIFSFEDLSDRAVLMNSYSCGVTVEEMKELGIMSGTKLSRKEQAALFARRVYNLPQDVAKRLVSEPFDDDQLDVIMSALLLPTFCIPVEKILDEILYAKYSMDEIIEWLNRNMQYKQ